MGHPCRLRLAQHEALYRVQGIQAARFRPDSVTMAKKRLETTEDLFLPGSSAVRTERNLCQPAIHMRINDRSFSTLTGLAM